MFYDSKPWVFAIIHLNQHAFLVLKRVTPTFSNLGILLKIDIKNCPLLGKLLSVWRTISVLPKSAQSANSAQTVENSLSFFNVSYTWYKSLHSSKVDLFVRFEIKLPVSAKPKIVRGMNELCTAMPNRVVPSSTPFGIAGSAFQWFQSQVVTPQHYSSSHMHIILPGLAAWNSLFPSFQSCLLCSSQFWTHQICV